MPSVLFVCTANRFRSPLAAAFFKRALGTSQITGAWTVASAGTWAMSGLPALSYAQEAARARGLDLSAHRSARVSEQLLSRFDLILVMESSQKEALQSEFPALYDQIYLLSNVIERHTYDIPDLSGSLAEVAEVCADLDELIGRGMHSICVLATYLYNARNTSTLHER